MQPLHPRTPPITGTFAQKYRVATSLIRPLNVDHSPSIRGLLMTRYCVRSDVYTLAYCREFTLFAHDSLYSCVGNSFRKAALSSYSCKDSEGTVHGMPCVIRSDTALTASSTTVLYSQP